MSTSVSLFPGIKSLYLVTDTPYDAIETTKVRNDLCGIKVWWSSTPDFHPEDNEGVLAFDGLSSSVTISGLENSKQYYVKYAFISSIEPDVYTILEPSPPSVVTYSENVTVYGYLTNPSSIIPTESDGSGANYTVAGGKFKVYSSNSEVTGEGVEYGFLSDSITGGLQVNINPTTGAYSVAGQTNDYASVILTALYDNVTVETTLVVIRARKGIDGTTAKNISISVIPGNNFIYANTTATSSDTAAVTLKANFQNFDTNPLATWTAKAYSESGTLLGNIAFTSDNTTNSITITEAQFNPTAYGNNVRYAVVTANYDIYHDNMTVYRLNNGADQLTLELSNENVTIPAYYDGTVVPSGYIAAGTYLKVYRGATLMPTAIQTPPLNGQWNVVSAHGTHITADTSPQRATLSWWYDTPSNMTSDAAYIDYTVLVKTQQGEDVTLTKRQTFSKSIGGTPGFTATLVNLSTPEVVFIKFKDGTWSSEYVTIFADTQNIPDPKKYEWDDGSGTIVTKHSTSTGANQFRFNRPSTIAGTYPVKVTVTCEDTTLDLNPASDIINILILEEGSDAYNFLFRDPYVFLSANSSGIVEGGVTSTTNHIIGARGIQLLTPGTDINYTVESTENCIATMGAVTGTWNKQFTISGDIYSNASITTAKVTIRCTPIINGVEQSTYFLQTCYITKVLKGANGTNAFIADLISEADVTTSQSDGTGYTLPTGNALRLYNGGTALTTGVTYGGTATKNGLTLTINSTGAITLSGSNWTSDTETFNVTATLTSTSTTYTAAYTIAKSKAGSDAVFVDLLSETEIVTSATDGTGYTLPTGNSMRVFKGGVQVTTGVSYTGTTTKNGLTLTIDANTGALVLSGTAWTSDKETFTLTATYGNKVYPYTYKIVKSKAGTTGNNTATIALYAKNTSNSVAPTSFSGTFTYRFSDASLTGGTLNDWTRTAPSITNGEYLWVRYGTAISNTATDTIDATEFSTAVVSGVGGNNGTNARSVDLTTTSQVFGYNTSGTTPSPASTVLTATGQNTSGTVYYEFLVNGTSVQNTTTNTYTYTPTAAYSSMPQIVKVNLREGSSTGSILATDVMSMIGIKPGVDGVSAVSGFLTNESFTVATSSNGSGGSYTNAGGIFKVYDGISDVTGTAAVQYSVPTQSGVSITLVSSGVYTINSLSADQGSATLRAVYKGVTIEKVYDISRAKSGAPGAGTWTPVMTAGVVQDPNNPTTFYKASGTYTWDGQVYSAQSYTNGAYVSFNPASSSGYVMVGLNTDPTTDASYTSIDYCFYLSAGTLYIYESAAGYGPYGSYSSNTALSITYDNVFVKYYKDGTLLRSVPIAGQKFYLDSSFFIPGDSTSGITNLVFGPQGASGTSGSVGPKATSGYIYYSISQPTAPSQPTATSFNFSDGSFNGLTAGWGTNITMTGNGTYWASRYNVTESTGGSSSGAPTFSAPFNHQNFTGLVTFNNLTSYATTATLANYASKDYADTSAYNNATQYANSAAKALKDGLATYGYTTIDGGNIITGTVTTDKISSGTFTASAGNIFSFGVGTSYNGIATVGLFSTTSASSAALTAASNTNLALATTNISYDVPAAMISNRYGSLLSDISPGSNISLAILARRQTAGFFQIRYGGGAADFTNPDNNTRVWIKLAYETYNARGELLGTIAGKFHNSNGNDVELGAYDYALNVNGAAQVVGNLSVQSLKVGGVTIDTNGGGSSGYGQGSSPQFENVYCSRINAGGYNGYTGPINNGDIAAGGRLLALGNLEINGQVYSGSSIRYKENIEPIDIGLNFVLSLNPVKFDRKSDKVNTVGFIAEDFPDTRFIGYSFIDPDDHSKGQQVEAINYVSMVAPLVKAIQELNAKITQLTAEIETLKAK